MKKLTVVFGGNVGFYLYYFRTINAIEKSLKCKIKRTGHFSFSTKVNDIVLEFLFHYGPVNDSNYKSRKKSFALNEKEIIPPPADRITDKIRNSDAVLMLGVCGGINFRKSEICLPIKFSEILFEKPFIGKKEVLDAKGFREIKSNNFLTNELVGKKTKILTSNLTFQPKSTENEKVELLIDIANSLSKKVDVIDKESYQIAKASADKKFGAMLMVSDVVNEKRFMLKGEFKPNLDKFNKNCIKAIKIAMKKI